MISDTVNIRATCKIPNRKHYRHYPLPTNFEQHGYMFSWVPESIVQDVKNSMATVSKYLTADEWKELAERTNEAQNRHSPWTIPQARLSLDGHLHAPPAYRTRCATSLTAPPSLLRRL